MVKVYFQSEIGSHSELVATFRNEELYMAALPSLEKMAAEQRCFVTEEMSKHHIDEAVASEAQAVGFNCLHWSILDFDKDEKAMNKFFLANDNIIIQFINDLIEQQNHETK